MKILLMVIFPTILYTQNHKLSDLFVRSTTNITSCDSLIQFCLNEKTPQQIAYLGAGFMLKSRHSRKLKYFKEGKKILEEIIKKYPSFVELRWIRYCIQMNSPKILNYKQNIENDKSIIETSGSKYQKKIIELYE